METLFWFGIPVYTSFKVCDYSSTSWAMPDYTVSNCIKPLEANQLTSIHYLSSIGKVTYLIGRHYIQAGQKPRSPSIPTDTATVSL